MSNPFSNDPTIQEEQGDEVDTDWGDDIGDSEADPSNPGGVKEDYDRVPATGNEVVDEDGDADEEWAQTPTELFATMDNDDFYWVIVTLDDRGIPHVKDRFIDYDDYVEKREWWEPRADVPEGIHVQMTESRKIRYVKGEDMDNLLEWRGLA